MQDGLPDNSIQALAQTTDGYLWVGTTAGLARFNGVEFKVFRAGNIPGLINSETTSLWANKEGGLWVGTVRGLSFFKNGAFTNVILAPGEKTISVRSLFADESGSLCANTDKGLFFLSVDGVQLKPKKVSLPQGQAVRVVCGDGE
jgi:ligand-binding sensor domain-containing protein